MPIKKNKAMTNGFSGAVRPPEAGGVSPAPGRPIGVAVVEDNSGLRRTLTRLISHAPGLRCVGAWPDGESALAEMPALKPDVVLMDINLPGVSGIECTARFKQICPETQVIMVTVYQDADNIFRALQAGACGYLLKRASSVEILDAILEAHRGGAPMTSQIARKVVEAFRKPAAAGVKLELSPREREVLELIAKGFVNKEVAAQLNIAYETVKGHTKNIYEKLHVHSRSEALMKLVADEGVAFVVPGPLASR